MTDARRKRVVHGRVTECALNADRLEAAIRIE
jgi:hypothetical protein